jgi:hypothetical protein
MGRPVRYLESSKTDKDAVARAIARKDGITEGLVALLKCVEPCVTYGIGPNPKTGTTQLRSELGRCLHFYYHLFDPVFGFMNARIQTWFPFSVQICINGREWLVRQMDAAGLPYERLDNCFTRTADFARARRLMDQQSGAAGRSCSTASYGCSTRCTARSSPTSPPTGTGPSTGANGPRTWPLTTPRRTSSTNSPRECEQAERPWRGGTPRQGIRAQTFPNSPAALSSSPLPVRNRMTRRHEPWDQ